MILLVFFSILTFNDDQTTGKNRSFAQRCELNSRLDVLNEIKAFSDSYRRFDKEYYESVERKLSVCEEEIKRFQLINCVQNTKNYIQVQLKRKSITGSNSLDFEISDEDYFNSIDPSIVSLPYELSQGLPENIVELAAEKNWKILRYRSMTVNNPPHSSLARFLIFAPGEKIDKWIQFTLPEKAVSERLVDFIAVEKLSNQKNKIYFNQFWRDKDGKNPEFRGHGNFDRCYSCHPNGMRELSPEPASFPKEDAKNLAYMNSVMRSYGELDWGEAINPHGYQVVGEKYGCVQCHNNWNGHHPDSRGAINDETSDRHLKHKMIEEFTMPPRSLSTAVKLREMIDNIPFLVTEEQRLEVWEKVKAASKSKKISVAIESLAELGVVSKEQATGFQLFLKGQKDFPFCLGQRNCFAGAEKLNKDAHSKILAEKSSAQAHKSWIVSQCNLDELVPQE
jgi:hypothetical protein